MDYFSWISFELLLVLLFSNCATGQGVCSLEHRDKSCTYTVSCRGHPGAVANPSCDKTPNVTFIINNSYLETITSGYFTTTNFDSRVRQFILNSSSWETIESSAFKYYSKTELMDLSSNFITNINREAFSQLANLKTLNLSNNLISELPHQSFAFVSSHVHLETLDLSYNRISSLQNELFSHMPNLFELDLQWNAIKNLEENSFYNLRNLNIMNLKHNQIKTLNSTTMPLKSLKYLDLSYNLLTKLAAFDTMHLKGLEYLNISNNNLKVVEANCFSTAINLQTVDLSNNKIHSIIDHSMFINNKLLKYLNLLNNNITTIEPNSFAFNNIKYINIEKNNFTGILGPKTLIGLSHVISLNITHQNIKIIADKAFFNMTRMTFLNLSRNCIETVENSSFEFEDENSLSVLDMSHNKISSIIFLQNFTGNLTELYLNNNQLRILGESLLENLINLNVLDLSDNEIVTIEKKSIPLQNLHFLYITGNKMNGNITENIYSSAPYIKDLNLSHSYYKHIGENAFSYLPMLRTLNLSYNELDFIDRNNFNEMKSLYNLDLSFNKLENLELDTSLNSLKVMYLNNNKLKQIPNTFSNDSVIFYLDLSHNNITDINNEGFKYMSYLTRLDLSYNKISLFNNDNTNALKKLSYLALCANQISDIQLSNFKELTYVDLSKNLIKNVTSTMFEGLESLQYLDLSNNLLNEILPGTFHNQKVLKFLNISSNHLKALRYGSLLGLHQTHSLDLSKNMLTSLDVFLFHELLKLKTLIIDNNYIKSVDVDKLSIIVPTLNVLSLGGNLMSCQEIVRTFRNTNKSLIVTAIHKIYHDDNVHGINCRSGDNNEPKTESTSMKQVDVTQAPLKKDSANINSTAIIWCSILTVVLVATVGGILFSRYRKWLNKNRRMHFSASMNSGSIQCDRDLLS